MALRHRKFTNVCTTSARASTPAAPASRQIDANQIRISHPEPTDLLSCVKRRKQQRPGIATNDTKRDTTKSNNKIKPIMCIGLLILLTLSQHEGNQSPIGGSFTAVVALAL